MDELGCTGLVGRGSTSSAVVNQASREAVVLTLRASILTPARSAYLRRMIMGSGDAHIPAPVTSTRPHPPLAFRAFEFPSTGAGVKGRRGALYITFR